MRILLDTHALIWWDEGAKLSRDATRAIKDADQVYVSAVSAWEVAIKISLGKLKTRRTVADAAAESGFEELPLRFRHAETFAGLARHHRDPFDRMLIAQALAERLTLVTRDPQFAPYGVRLIAA